MGGPGCSASRLSSHVQAVLHEGVSRAEESHQQVTRREARCVDLPGDSVLLKGHSAPQDFSQTSMLCNEARFATKSTLLRLCAGNLDYRDLAEPSQPLGEL